MSRTPSTEDLVPRGLLVLLAMASLSLWLATGVFIAADNDPFAAATSVLAVLGTLGSAASFAHRRSATSRRWRHHATGLFVALLVIGGLAGAALICIGVVGLVTDYGVDFSIVCIVSGLGILVVALYGLLQNRRLRAQIDASD